MTDKLKARIQILYNRFNAQFKQGNPYTRGAKVWDWWYSQHGLTSQEPIPKEMLPTDEDYIEWDCKEAEWIASQLTSYNALLEYWESTKREKPREAIGRVVARTRPCEYREAQCNFFCQYYGTENCYGNQDNL